MIKNKKAVETMILLIVLAALGLALGGVLWHVLFPALGEALTLTKTTATEQVLESCLAWKDQPVTGPHKNICYNCDFDGDGLKDFCDNCPLIPNYASIPDNDKDLFPLGCCGNDGKLEWKRDDTTGKWHPKSVYNLPCYNPPYHTEEERGGRRDSIVEDKDADEDPSRHPVYKNIPIGTVAPGFSYE